MVSRQSTQTLQCNFEEGHHTAFSYLQNTPGLNFQCIQICWEFSYKVHTIRRKPFKKWQIFLSSLHFLPNLEESELSLGPGGPFPGKPSRVTLARIRIVTLNRNTFLQRPSPEEPWEKAFVCPDHLKWRLTRWPYKHSTKTRRRQNSRTVHYLA